MKIQLFFLTRILHYNVFVKKKKFQKYAKSKLYRPFTNKILYIDTY